MAKSLLVTGAAGFIGSHLCRRLVDQGHDVLCVDNLYTGNRDNLFALLPSLKVTVDGVSPDENATHARESCWNGSARGTSTVRSSWTRRAHR